MSQHSPEREAMRQLVMGLGTGSFKKHYYPSLMLSVMELKRFRAVVETIPDLIMILDADAKVLDANKSALDFFGRDDASLKQARLHDLVPDHADALLKAEGTKVLIRDAAMNTWREAEVRRFTEERPGFYIFVGRDVSARMEAEARLRTMNEDLESKVAERTQQIREAQEHLIQSEKMASLGVLVAGISHEISTPLGTCITAITGLLPALQPILDDYRDNALGRRSFEDFMQKTATTLEVVEKNLYRAADLVQSFKRISVDRQTEETRDINFRHYLEDIMASLGPRWRGRHYSIEGDPELVVFTHPGAWSQIVGNLVINSITHGFHDMAEDRECRIRIRYAVHDGRLVFDYRDNGRGVDPANEGRIFDPFFTTARSRGGTGLGLPIVFNLVSAQLRGTIHYFRPPEGGFGMVIDQPLGPHGGS